MYVIAPASYEGKKNIVIMSLLGMYLKSIERKLKLCTSINAISKKRKIFKHKSIKSNKFDLKF